MFFYNTSNDIFSISVKNKNTLSGKSSSGDEPLSPIAVNNKGGMLSLRRRRVQFSLMGLIVLIGLLLATGAGVFSIFGSSDQLILEQEL